MWISIDEGPDRGKSIEVTSGSILIGRSPDAQLVLSDQEASSRHATIEADPGGNFILRDQGSTNGTFVDGQRVTGPVLLTGAESIKIGQAVIRLSKRTPGATVVAPQPVFTPQPPAAAPPAYAAAQPGPPAPPPPMGGPPQYGPPGGAPPTGFAGGPPAAPAGGGGRGGGPPRILIPIVALLVIAVIVVVVVVASGGGKKKLTQQELISQSTPSVVRIEGDQGGGSGFVIDAKKGWVLTNAHVVVGNSALKAQIGNKASDTSPARIVATDPCDDLAVLRLVTPVSGLKALPLGKSSTVKAGDQVTVLGFPGSLQATVSNETTSQSSSVVANTGTVSQTAVKATPDPSLPEYQNTIVHQAPVNHGDSGGPLLNSDGDVVGINTLTNTNNQGQYYAISIDYAKRLLPSLEAGQNRSAIGWDLAAVSPSDSNLVSELESLYAADRAFASNAATLAQDTANLITSQNISGLYDVSDQTGSAADKTSTAGYLFDTMNGDSTKTFADMCNIIDSLNPGDKVKLHGYNIDAGSDPSNVSGELLRNGHNPVFTGTLTIPKN